LAKDSQSSFKLSRLTLNLRGDIVPPVSFAGSRSTVRAIVSKLHQSCNLALVANVLIGTTPDFTLAWEEEEFIRKKAKHLSPKILSLKRIAALGFKKSGRGRRLVCVALVMNLLVLPLPYGGLVRGLVTDLDETLGVSRTVDLVMAMARPRLIVSWEFGVPVPLWIPSAAQSVATSPPS